MVTRTLWDVWISAFRSFLLSLSWVFLSEIFVIFIIPKFEQGSCLFVPEFKQVSLINIHSCLEINCEGIWWDHLALFVHSLVSSPGVSFIVACFAFFVDFPQQVLVVCKLLLVHTAHSLFWGFISNLILQELHIILIDALNLWMQSILLKLIILLILGPDLSLLIVESFLLLFSKFLLIHLLEQKLSHILLL